MLMRIQPPVAFSLPLKHVKLRASHVPLDEQVILELPIDWKPIEQLYPATVPGE